MTSGYSRRDTLEFTGSAVLTIAVIAVGTWLAVVWQPTREREAKEELASFAAQVELGAPVETVRELFDSRPFAYLEWHSEFHPYFVVKTPNEAGAYNWVLWLEDRGGVIVGARIRQWKHKNIKPGGSPEDRFIPDKTRWPEGLAYAAQY